ncbi:MAG: ATP-binding cassette domain-containing protein [Spirochaetaceae bacterium]|nr:ATP-binding cassette domain-containing protein [Spirochaetaceae bacterium]
MIRIEDLSVVFAAGTPDENRALAHIGLCVDSGDFVTIIGSNGAGKSTLYNAIAGTVPVTSGRIFVRLDAASATPVAGTASAADTASEREITREAEYRRARYIGRIFQNPLLGTAGKMSLEDNMVICRKKGYKGLVISLNRRLREEFREQLRVLDMGLENRLADNVELFSGGQRQALTLLMAVISGPGLLLLDEHTAALDPRNAELIMELTMKFAAQYRLTVMMITHNMSHAIRYGNRLLIMDSGEVIQDIGAAEKERLTVRDVVERFRTIRKRDLANDELLLN